MTDINLTAAETKVIKYMAEEAIEACGADLVEEARDDYCAPCGFEELAKVADMTTKEIRGVISSLIQKDLVMNDNDWTSQDVPPLWLTDKGFDAAEKMIP